MNIDTNGGGKLISKQKCSIPLLGEHWFNEESLTNIISLADMASRFRVTMDTEKDKAFLVHLPDKIVRFKQLNNNLYGMDPTNPESFISKEKNTKNKIQLLEVVDDNLKYLSARQQKRAKLARKAYQAIGTPTTEDFKAMIRMNLIKDLEITTEDVTLAEKAFGPDIGALKGKTTRKSPAPAFSNVIEIPTELLKIHEEIVLSIDGLTVNMLKFLTSISHEVFYRTGKYIAEAKAINYVECMQEIYNLYKLAGFIIREIHCDNEFHKAMNKFAASQNPPIKMNYSAAQEHVPRAERNNRVIQERVRASFHQMPYEHLPRILIKYMVSEAARKLNYFPAKHGISKHYSPRMIMHQENLNFNRHCKYVLGEYVQAHEDSQKKNNNLPRTLDCLYLRPTGNHQGGHELLHLHTNKVIT